MSDTSLPDNADLESDADSSGGESDVPISRRDAITSGAAAVVVGLGSTHALSEGTQPALAASSGIFAVGNWSYEDSAATLSDIHIDGSSYIDLSWDGFRAGDELYVSIFVSAPAGDNSHIGSGDGATDPRQVLEGTITLPADSGTDERFNFNTDVTWTDGNVPQSLVSDGDGSGGHSDLTIEDHFEPDDGDWVSSEEHYERVTDLTGEMVIESEAPLQDEPVEAQDSASVTVQYEWLTDIPQGGINEIRFTSDGMEVSDIEQLGFVAGGEAVDDVDSVGFI